MRVILIGEAPSKRGDRTKPLDYRCFDGLDAVKINLFYTRDQIEENDGKWPAREANREAGELAKLIFSRRYPEQGIVIFIGKRTAKAFDFKENYFVWRIYFAGFKCATFPHPSGLNRWWNDAGNRLRAKRFLRSLNFKRKGTNE